MDHLRVIEQMPLLRVQVLDFLVLFVAVVLVGQPEKFRFGVGGSLACCERRSRWKYRTEYTWAWTLIGPFSSCLGIQIGALVRVLLIENGFVRSHYLVLPFVVGVRY